MRDDDMIFCIVVVVVIFVVLILFGRSIYQDVWIDGPIKAKEAAIAAEKAKQAAEIRAVPVENKTQVAEAGKRFVAEFHGEFFGGFQNNKRDIFIVRDNQTGQSYLAITGCGVSELRTEQYTVRSGKTSQTRTRVVEE
jgi:hypothetical protein